MTTAQCIILGMLPFALMVFITAPRRYDLVARLGLLSVSPTACVSVQHR